MGVRMWNTVMLRAWKCDENCSLVKCWSVNNASILYIHWEKCSHISQKPGLALFLILALPSSLEIVPHILHHKLVFYFRLFQLFKEYIIGLLVTGRIWQTYLT